MGSLDEDDKGCKECNKLRMDADTWRERYRRRGDQLAFWRKAAKALEVVLAIMYDYYDPTGDWEDTEYEKIAVARKLFKDALQLDLEHGE